MWTISRYAQQMQKLNEAIKPFHYAAIMIRISRRRKEVQGRLFIWNNCTEYQFFLANLESYADFLYFLNGSIPRVVR